MPLKHYLRKIKNSTWPSVKKSSESNLPHPCSRLLIQFHDAFMSFTFMCRMLDREMCLYSCVRASSVPPWIKEFEKKWNNLVGIGAIFFESLPSSTKKQKLYRAENLLQYKIALEEGQTIHRNLLHLHEYFIKNYARTNTLERIDFTKLYCPAFLRLAGDDCGC